MLEELYNSASCNKEKLLVENASHGSSYWIGKEKYWASIKKFIDKNL